MKYIQGQNRSQTYLFPVTLDDAISEDNEVRLIDVFVDSLAFLGKMEYWKPREILSVNRLSLIPITSSSRSF